MSYFKKLYYRLIGKTPDQMEMVKYWKTQDSVAAKVTRAPDGSICMKMEGEDHLFPSFPRGYLLLPVDGSEYSHLSILKHQIKNQIFNESWWELETEEGRERVIDNIKHKLKRLSKYFEPLRYDMLPPKSMAPAVREIYRAWTEVGGDKDIRDYLTFILQEDDAYRFRVQWLAEWYWLVKYNPLHFFDKSLRMLEHAEILGDMKERARLLRRILMLVLEDEGLRDKFEALFKEINWKKVKLSEGDKYHFRGKYFKVDYKLFDY